MKHPISRYSDTLLERQSSKFDPSPLRNLPTFSPCNCSGERRIGAARHRHMPLRCFWFNRLSKGSGAIWSPRAMSQTIPCSSGIMAQRSVATLWLARASSTCPKTIRSACSSVKTRPPFACAVERSAVDQSSEAVGGCELLHNLRTEAKVGDRLGVLGCTAADKSNEQRRALKSYPRHDG
jgi:hypothetical protein